jgi:hypothetical protein
MKTFSFFKGIAVFLLLVALHYTVRPLLGTRISIDFLVIAVLLTAVHVRPGVAALTGFLTGLIADSLTPLSFGAGALAMSVVGSAASWLRAVVSVDNMLFQAIFLPREDGLRHHVPCGRAPAVVGPIAGAAAGMVSTVGDSHRPGWCPRGAHLPDFDGVASMSLHPNELQRRGRSAGILAGTALGILLVAFFRAQVIEHAEFALQSDDNRLNEVPLPAPRGMILDRNGQVIAENIPGYNVSILSRDPTPRAPRCSDCRPSCRCRTVRSRSSSSGSGRRRRDRPSSSPMRRSNRYLSWKRNGIASRAW